jgi:hypothetical protein
VEILNKKPPEVITPGTAQNGYVETKKVGYTPEKIKDISKNMFYDKSGNPTEYAVSFMKQKGIYDEAKIKDKVGLDELATQFETEITPFLTSKLDEGFDKDRAGYDQKNRQIAIDDANKDADRNLKREIAKGKGDIKQQFDSTNLTTYNENDNQTKYGGKRKGFSVLKDGWQVTTGEGKAKRILDIENVSIDPNNPSDIRVVGDIQTIDEDGVSQREGFSYESTSGRDIQELNDVISSTGMTRGQFTKMLFEKAGIKPGAKAKPKPKPKPNAASYGL